MNILFLHRNFPGQFKHLLSELTKDSDNKIFFITSNQKDTIEGINKIIYNIKENPDISPYLNPYSEAVLHAQAAANAASLLKQNGFYPDIIYSHCWGVGMFMKDVFPDVPLICYFEWFYNPQNSDIDFDGKILNDTGRAKIRCKNTNIIMDLVSCDIGITPTKWQKQQFPEQFQSKIKVIYDGVDTDFFKSDISAEFLGLCKKDKVITYATRGMEPYRGFPQFMQAASILMKKHPDIHVVIAGEDKVFYGAQPQRGTYKEFVLEKLEFDKNRLHFVGTLPFDKYLKLLQISSVHVYLTYPFVLSWSVLEAMSAGCCVVASNTQPVSEFVKDNHNGLLFDFYNINQMAKKIEFALSNHDKINDIRENARKIIRNYSIKKIIPKHIDFIKSLITSNILSH